MEGLIVVCISDEQARVWARMLRGMADEIVPPGESASVDQTLAAYGDDMVGAAAALGEAGSRMVWAGNLRLLAGHLESSMEGD
jgi:hypothetical protein